MSDDSLFPGLASPSGREAVRLGGSALTYRELAAAVAATAARLDGLERVAVWAETSLDTPVAVLAGLAAGVAVVPLNPKAGPRELGHVVADSSPGALLAPRAARLPAALDGIPRLAVLAGGRAGVPDRLSPEDVALVVYTSGTTGPPKGVQIPRRAIESNLDALAAVWAWAARDRLVHALPLFHVHGLVLGVLGPLRRGGSVELLDRFSPEGLARGLRQGGTMVFAVPTMIRRIAAAAAADGEVAAAFAEARLVVSGSAGLPASDHLRFEQATGQRVVERYGMTETLMNTSVRVDGERTPGSVGPPLPGVSLRLVDDAGAPVGADDGQTVAEIQVRGPNLFTGYLGRPEATAAAFAGGWFRTGDLATRDANGYVRIVGRRSTDLIKSGGYRIGAGEVEAALLEHPAVAEVAVAGRPDDDLGERVVAWVVREPGAAVGAEELSRHTVELIAAHKRPREVHFVDELPRNAMGKVLKRELP